GRGGEQLDEVDGAGHELAAVDGVDRRGPVRVGAGEGEGPEGGGEVDHGADVDGRLREPLGDLGLGGVLRDAVAVAAVRLPSVHPVVPGHDDVVEIEIYRDAGILWVSHAPSLPGRGEDARTAGCGAGVQGGKVDRSAPRAG